MRARRTGLLVVLGLALLGGAGGLSAQPWQGFTALAISPDGRWFATGGRRGEVLRWETQTGELQNRWQLANPVPIVGLAFGPQGDFLGVGSLDGTLTVVKPGEENRPVSSAIDPPWRSLSLVSDQWRALGAQRVWTFAPSDSGPLIPRSGEVLAPRASALLAPRAEAAGLWAEGSTEGRITVGTREPRTVLASWTAHEAAITGLALTPDGTTLLSCAYDGSLARWDPRSGRLLGRL